MQEKLVGVITIAELQTDDHLKGFKGSTMTVLWYLVLELVEKKFLVF